MNTTPDRSTTYEIGLLALIALGVIAIASIFAAARSVSASLVFTNCRTAERPSSMSFFTAMK